MLNKGCRLRIQSQFEGVRDKHFALNYVLWQVDTSTYIRHLFVVIIVIAKNCILNGVCCTPNCDTSYVSGIRKNKKVSIFKFPNCNVPLICWLAHRIFTAAIVVLMPAGAEKFHITNLYIKCALRQNLFHLWEWLNVMLPG